MPDNKKAVKLDRIKIDKNDPSEVEFVHQQFPNLSHRQVVNSIMAYGPSREKVYNNLRTKRPYGK